MTEPLIVPVKVGGRMVDMRPPNENQLAALLDFERQASLLDKMQDGPERNQRSVALARRSLLLIEKLMVNPADWDQAMDDMITGDLGWPDFNDIPNNLFDALEASGNRAARRSAAKVARTRVQKP